MVAVKYPGPFWPDEGDSCGHKNIFFGLLLICKFGTKVQEIESKVKEIR